MDHRWPLGLAAGWLALQVANPSTNNLTSGVAQAALNIAILCPAFWGGAALRARPTFEHETWTRLYAGRRRVVGGGPMWHGLEPSRFIHASSPPLVLPR